MSNLTVSLSLGQPAADVPPASNTGVLLTDGTCDLVDYVGLTMPTRVDDNGDLVDCWALWADLLGDRDWTELPRGGFFYPAARQSGPFRIYYGSDRADMGSHCELSGDACRELEASGVVKDWSTWASLCLAYGCKVSRLDLARDDCANLSSGLFSVGQLASYLESGAVSTRWKSYTYIEGRKFGGSVIGESVALGRRGSDAFLRVYDKALESSGASGFVHHVRCELEFRRDRAQAAFAAIATRGLSVVPGLLAAYLTVHECLPAPGQNKSRIPLVSWWKSFLDSASKVRLMLPKIESTLDRALVSFARQYGPLVAAIHEADADLSRIVAAMNASRQRWSAKHRRMIAEERARWGVSPSAEVSEVDASGVAVGPEVVADPFLSEGRPLPSVAAAIAKKGGPSPAALQWETDRQSYFSAVDRVISLWASRPRSRRAPGR